MTKNQNNEDKYQIRKFIGLYGFVTSTWWQFQSENLRQVL